MTTAAKILTSPLAREGGVVWITGLAESGKTTVAQTLSGCVKERGVNPVLLDGNIVREALGETRSFDRAGRQKMAYTYARLSHMLASQGQFVICSTISLYHEVHEWNRKNINRYIEVFLDVPMEELKKRDSKGIYEQKDDEEIVGIGVKPEFPVSPDLQIANFSDIDPETAASRILEVCMDG
ncbi:adenylyl-sulfate kinase [Streptomyces sp. NPDC050610]|uniref:adenylyl-sulfate kinase n=1 Tax=Streptomyces sp. NPDC050610 TaxID=3157097 RepID=UPI0034304204